MKKRKKQSMISIIAIVCMMLTMFSGMIITVDAVAATNVSNETELKAAITNASDGANINVISDITITSEVAISGKSITIEGNNHIIKVPITGLDDSGIYNVGSSTFRIFNITASGKTVEIDNLNVKGGGREGILNNTDTVLKLTNVNISNSNNPGSGGGIINNGGTVYLKNSNISRNAARNGGGFLNNYGSKMFIENSTFSENRSTSSNGGGGAVENQGYLYANNSTFSNNKSTELGGAINNYGGTAYFVNSTFTGNVAYGSFSGGAIANNGGTVKTLNSLFAYNYRNSGTQSAPNYSLNDVYAYNGLIDSYYCIFQDSNYVTNISNRGLGNTLYNANADGSDNTIFTNGAIAKVLGPAGQEIGTNTIFQPLLAKTSGSTTSALLHTASDVLGKGVRTCFTNGNGTPEIGIGYYVGDKWESLTGAAVTGSYEVTVDQNNITRVTPTVGAVVTTASDIYLLKVNAAAGGTVVGGTVYGDAYAGGTIVNLTAIPSVGYSFSHWEYVDNGTGTASTDKSFSVTVTGNITLKPVFTEIPDATFAADITAATNTDVNVTIDYPSDSAVKQYSLDGSSYNDYTGAITFNSNGTLYAKSQDAAGNRSNVSQYNVTNIDKTLPIITNVTGNPSDWISSDVTLAISALDADSGLNTGGAYSFDGGLTWTTSNTKSFSSNGTVNIKVKDNAGNIAAYDAINITKIDKTAPTNAKITIRDKEITSFLNTITFGLFFKDTVGVTITADSSISGVYKTEYQKVSNASDYNPEGTWTEGSSFSVNPDEKFIVYAKITDNAGNYVIIKSDGVVVDATQPDLELTPDTSDWTKDNVNVKVKVSDNLSGVKEVSYTTDEAIPRSGTVAITDGKGTITLTNEGQYRLTVTAKDNSFNEVSESADIKIDRTKPIITGAGNSSSYFIGRVLKLIDDIGEISEAAYKNGIGTHTSFKDGDLFENAGKYTITLIDKAGNLNTLSFEIKALPKVEDVVYTTDCKALIDSIRSEFNGHNDLPEPYKTDTDNYINALEDRYSQLDKEVSKIKTEVSNIDTKEDGLISQEGKIIRILSDISKLTKEQENILKSQINLLNSLLNKINTLKEQVETVKEMPKTGSVVDFNSLIIVGIFLSLIGIVLIRKKVEI